MTTQRKRITIPVFGGSPTRVTCAAAKGCLAVTPTIGDEGWRITHIPTACALPRRFMAKEPAIACMKELSGAVDWEGFTRALAKGHKMTRERKKIIRIMEKWGAEAFAGVPLSLRAARDALVRERVLGKSST